MERILKDLENVSESKEEMERKINGHQETVSEERWGQDYCLFSFNLKSM